MLLLEMAFRTRFFLHRLVKNVKKRTLKYKNPVLLPIYNTHLLRNIHTFVVFLNLLIIVETELYLHTFMKENNTTISRSTKHDYLVSFIVYVN